MDSKNTMRTIHRIIITLGTPICMIDQVPYESINRDTATFDHELIGQHTITLFEFGRCFQYSYKPFTKERIAELIRGFKSVNHLK